MEAVVGSGSDVVDATDVLVELGSADVVELNPTISSDAHPTTAIARAIETRGTRMDRDGSVAPKFGWVLPSLRCVG